MIQPDDSVRMRNGAGRLLLSRFLRSLAIGILLPLLFLSSSSLKLTAQVYTDDLPESQQSSVADTTPPSFALTWSSVEADWTECLAWGDYDGDGDLDLAVGNDDLQPNRLYRNDGGRLTPTAVWSSAEADATKSMAWGDYDGDGDLDLAVGNSYGDRYDYGLATPNRLYRNDGGMLTTTAVWSSTERDETESVAWGDYDGDGDLDLAVGNEREQSRLYRNDDGVLTSTAVWSSAHGDATKSVAWGDYDGDGDLDLALDTYLYRNDGGMLTPTPVWSSDYAPYISSVAWGDYDGDGDLDLAVGNDDLQPNRLYRNDGGMLTPTAVWSSVETDDTESVAWGDYDGDGDLDLAVGNIGQPDRLYRNDGGVLSPTAVWSSAEADWTSSVAWGDYDSDGDLDLAVGNYGQPNRLYRNDGGMLSPTALWSAAEADHTESVAWGDYDSDGDLDLALGTYLYRNDGGMLSPTALWSAAEADWTSSVAWGDYDGDGDLDLAVGTYLYRNDGGVLTPTAVWSATEGGGNMAWGDYDGDGDLDLALGTYLYRNDSTLADTTPIFALAWSAPQSSRTVAWGDYDGDGDLDLAVGNYYGQPNRLYRNDGGMLSPTALWSAAETDDTESVAWGDYDGDGDLDLAVGNSGQPDRLYRNDDGMLSPTAVWSSAEADATESVAWGDYDGDGDLDLAVGHSYVHRYDYRFDQPNGVYRNDGGQLTPTVVWSSAETDSTYSVAWGDYDGDGDLDLAVGNQLQPSRLYVNTRNVTSPSGLPGRSKLPVARLARPVPPGDANHYSAPNVWPASGSVVPISYTLSHPNSRPVTYIRAYYSVNGGGQWLPAVAATGTITTNLATSPTGIAYTYNWDVFASGFFGQSDNVVFRIVAVPDLHPVANSIPGPFLYGSNASSTFPFRVRGTQVRVAAGELGVPGALVYRQPAGDTEPAQLVTSLAGEPFRTDSQGYLQGRGTINVGDRLYALVPVTATGTYTLYHTSGAPTLTGLEPFVVSEPGVQTLDVSAAHPLVLFNLDVALEWDARQDGQFLAQLQYDLQRASEFLYDWTNGQAALGRLRIYHDARRQPAVDGWQPWLDAHVRIYASNQLRPSAAQGGIVSAPFTDTLKTDIIYYPGQLYMGSVWNRYGDAGNSLDEDWPRTLAHELGHYALYLQDNYLGKNAQGQIIPVDGCSGAMADPYRDDHLAGYGEFHPAAGWLPTCAETLSQLETGRSDWATITTFYGPLDGVTANAGPSSLPLAVTEVDFVEPPDPPAALKAPIFFLTQAGQRVQPGGSARAFLYQGDWVTDLGRPTLDQVLARGAAVGDRVCLYELGAGRLGCEVVTAGDEQLALAAMPGWQPDIQVSPVTSRTLTLNVAGVPPGLALRARAYPLDAPAGVPISLAAAGAVYSGTFQFIAPAFQGRVQVWVDEPAPRREALVDYRLGGNPGHQRTGGGHQRSGGGHQRSGGAPVMSADGQVILFAPDVETRDEWFYTLQAVASGVQPPPWATLVGQAYRLSVTANAPGLAGSSLSFSYLGREVPPGEEQWLRLYRWDGAAWQPLTTTLDAYHNMASAPVGGPGVYALMSSIPMPLTGPGWNLIGWPVPGTRPVVEALQSISGQYGTVYGYEPDDRSDPYDPWKMYDPSLPPYAIDLAAFEFPHGYWLNISATAPITLWVKGATPAALTGLDGMPYPPASYYGPVRAGPGFTPAAGLLVTARINGQVCGQTRTLLYQSQIVYAINVSSDGPGSTAGCGVEGRRVAFTVGEHEMATTAIWDNRRVWQRPLSVTPPPNLYLPLIRWDK